MKIFLILFFVNLTILQCGSREFFSDEVQFAKPRLYKIKLFQINKKEFATIKFSVYKKSCDSWTKIQTGNYKKEVFALNIITDEDLNNDGFNDLKISYAQAGRGSNSLDKLFIFDPITERLIEIENSQDYPNLHYNATRNCINSYSFYGGTATYFLKLEKNKLEEFGRVDFYNDTVRTFKIENGEEILLRKLPYPSEDAALFFSNFDPLQE